MSKPARITHFSKIKRALQIQLVLVTLLAFITATIWNITISRAVFVGAIIAWLGQAVFAWFSFRYVGAQATGMIMKSMYRGLVAKWFVGVFGLSIAFIFFKNLYPANVLIGYIILLLTNWLYMFIVKKTY